jgi:hypothetical protein
MGLLEAAEVSRKRNQRLETCATVRPSRSISYSWYRPGRVAARQARFELTAEGQSLGGQHPLQALPRSFGDLPQQMGR